MNNNTIRKPFSRVVTMLSYMDSNKVNAWKEEQLLKLKEAMDDGTLETDEDLWDNFIQNFKQAFTNQNARAKVYQALCKLKQEESLDDSFAIFKQLTYEAGIPLDNKETIETFKHSMAKGLTSAIINSPGFDPTADIPWTFRQWKK